MKEYTWKRRTDDEYEKTAKRQYERTIPGVDCVIAVCGEPSGTRQRHITLPVMQLSVCYPAPEGYDPEEYADAVARRMVQFGGDLRAVVAADLIAGAAAAHGLADTQPVTMTRQADPVFAPVLARIEDDYRSAADGVGHGAGEVAL